MIQRAKEAFNKGALLNEFIPVPEDLRITAGFLGDGEEQRKLEEQTEANRQKYGYGNWYDYCVNEWGTKWDVGADGQPAIEQDANSLTLNFDSAWSPPIEAYTKLESLGFEIRALYYEPGMAFCGIYECGCDDFFEVAGMSSEWCKENLPVELDEAYGISDAIAEYENEEAE